MVEDVIIATLRAAIEVSIRRADYWLVEVTYVDYIGSSVKKFQSAGRIIGWLKSSK